MSLFNDLLSVFTAYANKINGLKADLAEVNDSLAELDRSLEDKTGIFDWNNRCFIILNVDPVDLTPTANSGINCVIINCEAGDKFVVTAQGGNQSRAWGFIDANNHVLSVADASIKVEDLEITAPENAKKLIVNTAYTTVGHVYKVGDNLAYKVGAGGGMSYKAKESILGAFRNLTAMSQGGDVTYDYLCEAFFPGEVPDTITATYTQGDITTESALDDLKAGLVVKAYYGGSNVTVTEYILIGTLEEGTCTITVAHHGRIGTFNVVVASAGERLWINGYSAQNTRLTNINARPFYFPAVDYNYQYPVTIKSVLLNVATAGTLTFGHQALSTVTKYVDKSVSIATLESNFIVDEVATFSQTGLQKYTFQNPIVITSGQCFVFCKTGDTAQVRYGEYSPDVGFYYFNTNSNMLKHNTMGLGIDIFIE